MSFGRLAKIILFCCLVSSVNLNSMVAYGSGQDGQEEGIEIPRQPRQYSKQRLLSLSSSPLSKKPKDMGHIPGITLSEESDEEEIN